MRNRLFISGCLLAAVLPARAASEREILIEPGGLWLEKPLVIDAGSSGCVVRPKDPSRPAVISGGRRIRGWKVGKDGVWRVTLPEARDGRWNFSTLYVNGCRRFRPRMPESGFYLTHTNAFLSREGLGGFAFRRDDIREDWANRGDLELAVLHNWSMTRARIADIDGRGRLVKFASPRVRNYMAADDFTSRRYRIENVKEAFGKPGEWYLDRPSGILAYTPMSGEDPDAAEVVAPLLSSLVEVKGAKDVVFKDVVFAYQDLTFGKEGYFAYQSAFSLPAAVTVVASLNVRFERCAFIRVDGYALSIGEGSGRCRVRDSVFRDLGGGAVRMGLFRGRPSGAALVVSNDVANCRISDGGRRHPDAVAVLVGKSSWNRIVHNEISGFYYSGISCGWDWNSDPSNAHHNKIAFNRVYDLGQYVLSDMGLVYLLGQAPGTTVHDNYLHDIRSATHGGTGIYLDNGSGGVKVWNNFVRNTMRSLHQNYGDNCEVWNNLFVDGSENQWDFRPRYRFEGLNLKMTGNIFVWRSGKFMHRGKPFDLPEAKWREWNPPYWQGAQSDSNVYWNCSSQVTKFGDMTVERWISESGNDRHSFFGDPRFAGDVRGGDCALSASSPALKLGFKPFNHARAGLYDPLRLISLPGWEACSPYADVTNGVWTADCYNTELTAKYARCVINHGGWSVDVRTGDGRVLADGEVPFVRPYVGGDALCSTSMERLSEDCRRWHYGKAGFIDVKVTGFEYGWIFEIVRVDMANVAKMAVAWLRGVKCVKDVNKADGIVSDGKYAIALCGYGEGAQVHVGGDCLVYLQPDGNGSFEGLKAALAVVPCAKLKPALKAMRGMSAK